MKKIGTIAEELEACRAAFEASPKATWAWCCHHQIHAEPLTEPAENRIAFILSSKSLSEQAQRLYNFRPVKDDAAVKPASDAYNAAVKPASAHLRRLHKKEWPNNTWNGRSIFE